MAAPMENVEIRQTIDKKGKGLFAVRDIAQGDVILQEEPLVCAQFHWNSVYKYLACNHCMKSIERAEEMAQRLSDNPSVVLPHPECCSVKTDEHTICPQCQVAYCSSDCRDRAWEAYHRTLCLGPSATDPDHPLNTLQETWSTLHYPPETCSIMLIARMIATVKQASDKSAAIGRFMQFCMTTVNDEEAIAHKLLGQHFQDQQEVLRTLLASALFEEDLQTWFAPEGFRSLLALIGTNGQGVGSSSLSVWVKNCDELELPETDRAHLDALIDQLYVDIEKHSGSFVNCEGSALFSSQSASNHSCVPNAEVTFPHNNNVLAMVALEDISAGQEILISYLDECALHSSRHSRQKMLRENYLFNCACPKCISQADDPDVTSEEEEEDEEEEEEGMEEGGNA